MFPCTPSVEGGEIDDAGGAARDTVEPARRHDRIGAGERDRDPPGPNPEPVMGTARAGPRTDVSGVTARRVVGDRPAPAPPCEADRGRDVMPLASVRRTSGRVVSTAAPGEKTCGQGTAHALSGTAMRTTRDPSGVGRDGPDRTGRVDDERMTKRNITILTYPKMAVAFLKQDGVRWNYATEKILWRTKTKTAIYKNAVMNRNHKSGTNAAG